MAIRKMSRNNRPVEWSWGKWLGWREKWSGVMCVTSSIKGKWKRDTLRRNCLTKSLKRTQKTSAIFQQNTSEIFLITMTFFFSFVHPKVCLVSRRLQRIPQTTLTAGRGREGRKYPKERKLNKSNFPVSKLFSDPHSKKRGINEKERKKTKAKFFN